MDLRYLVNVQIHTRFGKCILVILPLEMSTICVFVYFIYWASRGEIVLNGSTYRTGL